MTEIDVPDKPKPEKPKLPKGFLISDGSGVPVRQPIEIVGETPQQYEIRPLDRYLRLPNNTRLLYAPDTALVPKADVELRDSEG